MDALASLSKDYEKQLQPMQFDVLTALSIVAAIQLASRHPAWSGPSVNVAKNAAIEISKSIIKIAPGLKSAIEMGWNPEFDS